MAFWLRNEPAVVYRQGLLRCATQFDAGPTTTLLQAAEAL